MQTTIGPIITGLTIGDPVPILPASNLVQPSCDVGEISHNQEIYPADLAGLMPKEQELKRLYRARILSGMNIPEFIRALKEIGFQLCANPVCYLVGLALSQKTLTPQGIPPMIVATSLDPRAIFLDKSGRGCFLAIERTGRGPHLELIPTALAWADPNYEILVEELEIPEGQLTLPEV